MTSLSMLMGAVRKLEQNEQQIATNQVPDRWYNLLVAPSCPPDKRLHIRSGIISASANWGWIMSSDFVPDVICDFENEEDTGLDLVFTNAGYYLPLILCYEGEWASRQALGEPDSDPPYFDSVVGNEAVSSAGAESQIDALLNDNTQWYNYRVPLWGVILKNDGNTGIPYAIHPIDAVSRGRSYLYRDCRARYNIFG